MIGFHFGEFGHFPAHLIQAKVIEPAVGHLFTIEQCRRQCEVVAIDVDSDGVESHPDDDMILGFLDAAVEAAEDFTGLSIALKTYEFALDRFPACHSWWHRDQAFIEVPVTPFVSVVQFLVGESSDGDVLVEGDDFVVDTYGQFAKLRAVTAWPTVLPSPNFITVQVQAGYPIDSDGVPIGLPNVIRQAIMLMLADWYKNREDSGDKQMYSIPNGAQALLRPRRVRLGMA